MTYVLLIRHAQNDWVKKNRLAGWLPNVHLNQMGIAQAESLAERLAHIPINAIYCSPLERCVETAQIVSQPHNLQVGPMPEIGEVHYGSWEGKKLQKLAKKKRKWFAVQHYPSRFRFPGGESFSEVQQRAVAGIEELCKNHQREVVAAISHADVIKLVLAYYLGLHIDHFQRLTVSPAAINVLGLSSDGPLQVIRINDAGPIKIEIEEESTTEEGSAEIHQLQEAVDVENDEDGSGH